MGTAWCITRGPDGLLMGTMWAHYMGLTWQMQVRPSIRYDATLPSSVSSLTFPPFSYPLFNGCTIHVVSGIKEARR